MTVALLGPVLLELAADAAVQAAVTRLRQRGTLRRVAKASYVEARRKDIRVTKRSLKQWLRRADVRSALAAGQVAEDEAAFARLRWLLGDTSGTDRHEQTRELLAIVLFQLLKESNPAHATALSTRWVTAAVADEGRQTRHVIEERHEALVEQLAETRAFPEHLRTLHPWRASRAEELAATWPQIKQLVASVAMASDRETLLDRWGQRPPTTLDEAPSEIWCWLGDVAVDYQARLAAVTFFRRGIDSGAHPSEYWFARAALAIVPDDQRAAEDLLREGGGDHRLCQAIRADLAGDAPLAATEISQWEPASDSDRALKALFLASWRYGQGEHNAAVDMIRTAAQAYPQSSALALRTAEMLMWQVHGEHSLRGSDDVQDALAWAIKARNAMRIWGGQSWRAVKVAIAATGLLHDLDRGYRLTQPPPAGEATAAEAEHPYVAKQAAVLSAMVGQFERAANLAANAGDDYTQATVEALIASETDNREAAQAAWHRAYAAANDDVERMQTAHTMVGFGFDLPDLGALENAFPEGVAELRTIAALPSDPEERLRALRVRAAESRRMTVELAGAYNDRDEFALAGQVLEDGGSRWSDPLLMKMAADRYRRAGDPPAAQRAAEAALSLAAGEWGGETETRMILFDALEAQGDNAGATREAGKLLQLDPANADARWALIYCLARQGDLIGAWNALTPAGDPSPPRDHRDVKAWVALLTRFDRSDQYLRRILDALARWRDQEEVLGALIAQAYLGLSQEGREPAEADLAALHAATKEYTQRFPDSRIFRAVPLDKNDPLGFVAESLRKRHEGLSEVGGDVPPRPLTGWVCGPRDWARPH